MIRRCAYCDVLLCFSCACLFMVHISFFSPYPLLSYGRYRTFYAALWFSSIYLIFLVGRLSLFLSLTAFNSITIAIKYGRDQCLVHMCIIIYSPLQAHATLSAMQAF